MFELTEWKDSDFWPTNVSQFTTFEAAKDAAYKLNHPWVINDLDNDDTEVLSGVNP